jgi:hypothetical protein
VRWDAAAGRSPGVSVGQAALTAPTLNVTCPLSLADARRGVRAQYIAAGAGALANATARGATAPVRIVNVSATNFVTNLVQPVALEAALPADLAAASGSSASSADVSGAVAQSAATGATAADAAAAALSGASPSPSSAPLAARVAFSYVLQTDCGAP